MPHVSKEVFTLEAVHERSDGSKVANVSVESKEAPLQGNWSGRAGRPIASAFAGASTRGMQGIQTGTMQIELSTGLVSRGTFSQVVKSASGPESHVEVEITSHSELSTWARVDTSN